MVKRILGVLALLLVTAVCWAKDPEQARERPIDLTELSLEELMEIEVTSVAKKGQKVSEAAAAIYVITQEDIRRSGATSIPEVLRMVPGLQVARINAHTWAISSRGFNNEFANKLLVLIDDRSVYTPLFSGVYWDVQDVLLEDVERIEVIRGPGAALWGANAVNGVINIITKSAKDTQDGLVSAGGGSEERGFGGVRYSGKLGQEAYYRIYTKYFNRDDSADPSGHSTSDDWDVLRGGFRVDWDVTEQDSLTLHGDIYRGEAGGMVTLTSLSPPFAQPTVDINDIAGGNLVGRWRHMFSETSDLAFQWYYDRTERDSLILKEVRDTLDFDFQHHFSLGRRQDFVWGLGYRFTTDKLTNSFTVSFDPTSRGLHLMSAFAQDELTIVKNLLRLTLGSKFEVNSFTKLEVQPNVRLLWTPHERHTLWAAVSRAVRTPSRSERDVRINIAAFPDPSGLTNLVSGFGSPDFESENLLAYEFGYRVQPVRHLSLDLAAFYNVYEDLRTADPGAPFLEDTPSPPHLVVPLQASNGMDGEAYGVEIAASWNVTNHWRLNVGYTLLKMHLHGGVSLGDSSLQSAEGDSPQNQFHLRSYLDLSHKLNWDVALYYVDSLPSLDVPSYVQVDTRLAWHPTEALEVSLELQNLLDDRHQEFGSSFLVSPTEIERGVYGKITWRF